MTLGQIVSILMRLDDYKQWPLAYLEKFVLPGIASGQFLLANARPRQGLAAIPVAVAIWARVSREVDRRLAENNGQPTVLSPADWHSGEIVWLLLIAGEQNVVSALFPRLQQGPLKGRAIKYMTTENGRLVVHTLPPN